MHQRKRTAGRPSDTHGSDFSYRLVVDSRYTKVTQGKSRLRPLIFVQATIFLIGLSCVFLTTTKKDERNTLAIAFADLLLLTFCVFTHRRLRNGPAGQLEMIHVSSCHEDPVLWRTLLGSGKIHRNLELGEVVMKKLVQLEAFNAGDYVLDDVDIFYCE